MTINVYSRPAGAPPCGAIAGTGYCGLLSYRWLLCLLWLPAMATAQLHHDLEVRVSPGQHSLEVSDTLSWSGATPASLEFTLHASLSVETTTPGAQLSELPAAAAGRFPALNGETDQGGLKTRRYRVQLPAGETRLSLRYEGTILHALQQRGGEYARSFSTTRGTIAEQGVFLAGQSQWYPQVDGVLMTFDLHLSLPGDWYGVSQGMRVTREAFSGQVQEHWRCVSPQEEIYLIAGRFNEYRQSANAVQAMVFLREADPALAQKYLDATADYVSLYADLIGPYPYAKFALVENFWETGYGMPSFTLLGPRVIRFPFILHSSYPHEILHNWWGNSVYIDYDSGNWAEGLTSYLADHLIKEQRGQAVAYRRTVLQKYTDYVGQQQDLPLTAFRARHSASSEAVGYGKTLMLFHMLRRQLGDATFIEGLRALYTRYRFRLADWDAVQQVFSEAAQRPLDDFFAQWVQRSGAPVLSVSRVSASPVGDGYRLSAVIEQQQGGDAYALRVPVAVQLEGQPQAWQSELEIDQKRTEITLDLPARPLQIDVDAQFDVFRRLHHNEIPPAVSQAIGADRILIVLPAAAPAALQDAYRALAETWQAGHQDEVDISYDNVLSRLPDDRSVWLFGWHNKFRAHLSVALADYAFSDKGGTVKIDETTLQQNEHAIVVMGRSPGNPAQALGWLAAGQPAALPGLGRKLPHYGRYSYLAFSGEAPDNVLKGQWPVSGSPMSVRIAHEDAAATLPPLNTRLPPRAALVAADEVFSATRMQRDIAFLADENLAGRGLGTPQLDRAADYIAEQFRAAGLRPGGDAEADYFQTWQATLDDSAAPVTLKNVIAVLPGTDPRRAGESLVIGAHYDHLGRGESGAHAGDEGRIHPGADDNASGIAVMLELARELSGKPAARTIVFVAFSGEESGRLGSRHYVQHSGAFPLDKTIAMVNLDTVGRLGERPLTVFGTGTAREWVHILRGAGYVSGVPIRDVADDFGSSDQTSFIEAGVPAVQLFSGVHQDYHRPGDRADKIDARGLVKTAKVLKETVDYLAERPQALHTTLEGGQPTGTPALSGQARRVSLGTVPDYTYQGDGVRITDVQAGTPAAQADLRAEDIIVAVNDAPVHNLRDYAQALQELSPGDEIRIRFLRNGNEQTVTTRVVDR
ncbi:MAG: M20/M25/M40 family metallo-hydrolase [Thiogranum sp.]